MFDDLLNSLIEGFIIALPVSACLLLVVAAFSDLRNRIIPNWISLSLIFLFIIFCVIGGHKANIWEHFLWGICVLAALLPCFAFHKIGGGDVKLMATAALWVGPISGVEFIVLTTLIGGAMAIVMISPTIRFVWDWGNTRLGTSHLIDLYPSGNSLPYGVAIASAGCVAISNAYLQGLAIL